MATDTQTSTEPRLSELVGGIVDDFQRLVQQQVEMVRSEMRQDWEKAKDATWPLACGVSLLLVGGLILSFMLIFLLHWLTAPAGMDPARLPLWSCFALVGAAFTLAGAILTYVGWRRFHSFTPFPEKSTDALKENIKWLTNKN